MLPLLLISGPVEASCYMLNTPTLSGWAPKSGARVSQSPVVALQWDFASDVPGREMEVRLESTDGVLVPTTQDSEVRGSFLTLELTVEDTLAPGAYRVLWEDQEVTHFVVDGTDRGPGRVEIDHLVASYERGCPGWLAASADLSNWPRSPRYRSEMWTSQGRVTHTHFGESIHLGDMGCGSVNQVFIPGERVEVRFQAISDSGEAGPWSRSYILDIPEHPFSQTVGVDWEKDQTWMRLVQTLSVFVVCLLAGVFLRIRSSTVRPRRLPAWMRGPTPMDGS